MAGLLDPYAPIRSIPGSYFTQFADRGISNNITNDDYQASQSMGAWTSDPAADWDALLRPGGFQSKYNEVLQVDDNTVRVVLQQPNAHKYDTMDALYKRGDDGNWTLQNDPMQAKSRQVSTGESFYRDPLEQFGKDFVLPAAAMYFGAQGLQGLMGAQGAGATAGATAGGASAGGAAAGMTAEQVAMLAANGLTDAQIAGMAAAAGDTAMAASLTGAGMGGGGLLATAPAAAPTTYAPATNAALAESAAGTAGYGASSAGAGGGAGEVAGGLFGGTSLAKVGGGLLDYAANNPKVVGGLLGGLAGATGGLDSGSSAAPYTGPMPTIERGQWQPKVKARQMELPQFSGATTQQGAAGSGLWRFMGGM